MLKKKTKMLWRNVGAWEQEKAERGEGERSLCGFVALEDFMENGSF